VRGWIDEARDHVRAILGAALLDANPQKVLRSVRREGDHLALPGGARVRLAGRAVRCLAVGKAAGGMAAHAQPWGPFAEALVVAPHEVDVPGFACIVGGHPVPDAGSLAAGERALALARACGPDDLLVLLLSGGASALCESPLVPLADLQRATGLLLGAGAPIEEVNAVRRHLSRVKGGRLAEACRGEVLLLAISDVEPGDLASLGSGPASADASTFQDALDACARHGVLDALPVSVRDVLDAGARGKVPETLKPGDPALARVSAHVLADNDTALRAAAVEAARLGYDTRLLRGWLRGEARERGRELAEAAREVARGSGRPVALLAGGETVVRVVGHGLGGRNQELALAAMEGLSAHDAVLAALGTDGRDGPTDAAGAIVDGRSFARARALGLDAQAHLEENDSHAVFEALGDLVHTGPTGTNVRDVVVVLVARSGRA
jgi:glycerate-2-kinase